MVGSLLGSNNHPKLISPGKSSAAVSVVLRKLLYDTRIAAAKIGNSPKISGRA